MKTISYFLNPGQKSLAADGPEGLEAVSNMTGKSESQIKEAIANRAGAPARKAENLTIAKMGNMNTMPFQNAAQVQQAGMMGMAPTPTDPLGGMNQVVQGGIPGTVPGAGNVPGVNQVPNPVARLGKKIKHSKVKPFTITEDQLERKSLIEDQMESGNPYNQAVYERDGYGPVAMDNTDNRTLRLGEKYSSGTIENAQPYMGNISETQTNLGPGPTGGYIKKGDKLIQNYNYGDKTFFEQLLDRKNREEGDASGYKPPKEEQGDVSMGTRLGDEPKKVEPKRIETKKGPKLVGSF